MSQDDSSLSVEEKRELLVRLLRTRHEHGQRTQLSPAQLRIWAVNRLEPKSPVYNICVAYQLEGRLRVELLEQSIQEVIRRHASLRTSFSARENAPAPVIADDAPVKLDVEEIDGDADDPWPPAAEEFAKREASRHFDLTVSPLWRFRLLRWTENRFALIVTIHHIIADRWSFGIIAREISECYAELFLGNPLPSRECVTQYHEYAVNVNGPELRELAENQRMAWGQYLEHAEALQLPGLRQESKNQSYGGERHTFDCNAQTVAAVEARARHEGVSIHSILLATFAILLYRSTRQRDQLVCAPVTGRHRANTKDVVGYFNNILPIRIELRDEYTFHDVVHVVTETTKQAYEIQDLSFQQIAELPQVALIPLTRCMFSLQNTQSLKLCLPHIECDYRDVPNGASNCDVSVFIEQRGAELLGIVDFKTARFEKSAIVDVCDKYQDTLSELIDSPSQRIGELARYALRVSDSTTTTNAQASDAERPRSELERRLIAVWEDVLERKPLNAASNFFDLGGHSLLAARLFERVEREFDQQLPLATLIQSPTIRGMADIVSGKSRGAAAWASLVPIQPEGDKPPFFCIHGGGGNILSYRRLAEYLGTDQPLYGLQARGLSSTESASDRVEDMANRYLASIQKIQPDGPYLLGGHSLGAVVAYEMARQLEAQNKQVAFLALFDHAGPDSKSGFRDWFRLQMITLSQLDLKHQIDYVRRGIHWKVNSQMKLPKWLRLAYRVSVSGGDKDKASYRVRMLEASLRAIENYKIQPYSGRVTLFRAIHGPPRIHLDDYGGWRSVALGGVDVREVPGDHMKMFDEPHVRAFALSMRNALNDVIDAI